MPNDITALRSTLNRALSNNIISKREANSIVDKVKADGVTEAEVSEVVSSLQAALADGLDLSTATRRRNLNNLLGKLDAERPLPLDRSNASTRPDGSMDFISLLRSNQQPRNQTSLPDKSYTGQELKIGEDGKLQLGDQAIKLDGKPDQKTVDALMGLQKPEQLKDLGAASKQKLADNLIAGIEKTVPVPLEGAGKHKKSVAATASFSALDQLKGDLGEAQVGKLLDLYDKAPTPMAKSLLHRSLEGASKSDAQKTRFEGLEKPEHQDDLLKAWDEMKSGQARVDWSRPEGEAAQFGLSALTYAKKQTSIDNIYDGMKTYKEVNSDYGNPWDAQEVSELNKNLEGYVEKYPQTAFVFGTFSSNAPKEVAKLTNARIQAAVAPGLEGASPKLGEVPLSRAQADYVKTLLPGLKDERAVSDLEDAISEAGTLFSNEERGRGMAPRPSAPLSPAAFEQFKRSADRCLEQRADTKDGMLDMGSLEGEVKDSVRDIRAKLSPRLEDLNGDPPMWREVKLSAAAATELKDLLHNNLRSELSVDNLTQAIRTVSAHHGGKLEGDGLAQFKGIVDGYKAEWSGEKFFDFNKLGRIAGFKVQGKEVPLSTLNGQPVSMAQYNGKVAKSVAASIDRSVLKQPWMADRWGYRAKASVELLDVIAQQTSEKKGPVHILQQQFPGKQIEVMATGMDGGHQRFVYEVKDGSRQLGRFTQGTDGAVRRYRGGYDPVMFRASVRDDGSFDVQVPDSQKIRKYPLQTSYDIGDSIDWPYKDGTVEEAWDEGEKFTTQHKILEAKIKGYDAYGNYTISYKLPDGTDKEETVLLSKIKKYNNPHLFSERSSRFSDVSININSDADLKKFLDEAQPIIDKHLPQDGSLATLSSAELTKRQKAFIKDIQDYVDERISYPADKDSSHLDDGSKRYHELDESWRFPLGELAKIGKGVCRHQCIFEQLLLQRAGIDSRLASGAANSGSGNYRGLHIWSEVSLANNARYLTDQTWSDPTIPLWDGAYDSDKSRAEMYHRTARYDTALAE